MKKILASAAVVLACISFSSCGGGKESAESVAKKWCELNGKAYKAEGADKEKAEAEREKYEKDMEAKYKDDKAFMAEVEKEVNKCEDASEGR